MSYDRAKSIFMRAAEMASADERAAYVAEACGDDAALKRDVEELLRHEERLGSFLDDTESESTGTTIGPYRLLEEIGEGGFGIVYVAEQTEPVRRRVALKVIKAGMDTREVVSRFEAERQALALMDHPHIARVFDGGSTPGGRPFFVMELVKGVHIQDYCDQCQMPLRARLELFVRVCRAVQHAHQKGIIHRDLKPSNVLVAIQDGGPVPKVIDFGVAKATGQQLTEATFHTRFAQMIGTPQYMSPEQAEMSALDVDTRSDIYSLGVLLYELLTGTTPLTDERLKTITFDELRKIIREEDPPTPSARLTTLNGGGASIAAARRTELRRLVRTVRGELDWIVMKAIEKDRTRRYETASALAADIERYLAQEPVEAGPPSTAYRLRKFGRRNRTALAMVAVVATALLFAGWDLRERAIRQARIESEVEAAWREAATFRDQARAATDDPARWKDSLAVAFAALKSAESLLASAGSRDPTLAVRLRDLRADLEADERDQATVVRIERARVEEWLSTKMRTDKASWASRSARLRVVLVGEGIDPDALSPEQAATRIAARNAPVQSALVWALISRLQIPAEVPEEELKWIRTTLRFAEEDEWRLRINDALGRKDSQELEEMAGQPEAARQPMPTVFMLAGALFGSGSTAAGIDLLRRVQQYDPGNFWVNWALGWELNDAASAEAITYFRISAALRPSSAAVRTQLGVALEDHGDPHGAIAEFRRVIELEPSLPLAYSNLANSLTTIGEPEAAVAACRKAIELAPDFGLAYRNLGVALEDLGRPTEAAAAYRKAMELDPKDPGSVTNLGTLIRRRGEFEEALALQRKAVELDPENSLIRVNLGVALESMGNGEAAIAEYRKAVDLDPANPKAYNNLGNALRMRDESGPGMEMLRKAIELDPGYALAYYNLGQELLYLRKIDEAIAALEKALEFAPGLSDAHNELGAALAAQGHADQALARYRKAIALDPRNGRAWKNLAGALLAQGSVDDAIEAYGRWIAVQPRNGRAHFALSQALLLASRPGEAAAAWSKALELAPTDPAIANGVAWTLATSPDPSIRDPERAVELAKRAVELAPQVGAVWNTLGVARYRAGALRQAIDAFQESMKRRNGGDANDWYFLAMAHARLDHNGEARKWYDRAVAWTEEHAPNDEELRRFRLEARGLLGIDDK